LSGNRAGAATLVCSVSIEKPRRGASSTTGGTDSKLNEVESLWVYFPQLALGLFIELKPF